jgi:glycosyltransferase involved in cell wall biosynthesis
MNGVDPAPFPPPGPGAGDEARGELGLAPNEFVAGSAGSFVRWKRHEDFIRAVRAAREAGCRGILFGDDLFSAEPAYAAEIVGLAAGTQGGVVLPGWRSDLARLLPALDCFVSASENEPFGRTLVEAMLAGIPVVSTDSGGKPEIVVEGETGLLVPQGEVEATARALGRLRDAPDVAGRMGRAGRARALAHFTVDRVAREIEAIYDDLLGATGKPLFAHDA